MALKCLTLRVRPRDAYEQVEELGKLVDKDKEEALRRRP